jgi:hypothetical protein
VPVDEIIFLLEFLDCLVGPLLMQKVGCDVLDGCGSYKYQFLSQYLRQEIVNCQTGNVVSITSLITMISTRDLFLQQPALLPMVHSIGKEFSRQKCFRLIAIKVEKLCSHYVHLCV